jgi:hypothetical protein
MGIEILRPEGTNFDSDEVITRPDFVDTTLFGKERAFNGSTSKDDRTHYMLYRTGADTGSGYLRGFSPLEGTIKTNKQSYTFDKDMMDSNNNDEHEDNYSLSKKGEG